MRYFGVAVLVFGFTFASQTAIGEAAQDKITGTSKTNGFLMIYGQQGLYDTAQISVVGPAGHDGMHRCGGKTFSKAQPILTVSVPKNGRKVTCSALGPDSSYMVTIGVKSKDSIQRVSKALPVDTRAGYCTFVHIDQSKMRSVKASLNSCNDKQNDVPKPITPQLDVTGAAQKNGRQVSGSVRLVVAGLLPTMCQGQIDISLHTEDGSSIAQRKLPVSLADHGGELQCVTDYSFSSSKGYKPGTYTIEAHFDGNPYISPAESHDTRLTVVESPKIIN